MCLASFGYSLPSPTDPTIDDLKRSWGTSPVTTVTATYGTSCRMSVLLARL